MGHVLPQPGLLFTAAAFIFAVGVLVFVHEGGHYLAGRLFRVRMDAFAFGFGRELFGRTDARGTRWRINAVPLGGYVKFTGDMNPASQPSPEIMALPHEERADLFLSKPIWQRAIIVAAGPVVNFVFAVLILAGLSLAYGHMRVLPVVDRVVPGGAAEAAGLMPGDRILAINGDPIDRFDAIADAMNAGLDRPAELKLQRGSQVLTVVAQPRIVVRKDLFGNASRTGQLGIEGGREYVNEQVGPLRALALGAGDTWRVTVSIATTLKQIVTGQRGLAELGGPIKTAQVTGQQASLGLPNYIAFLAFFSINLGFINLLPIPVLDGGHLFLYALEALRRRPLRAQFQEWAFISGFAALVSLMVILSWNDLGFGRHADRAGAAAERDK
jgi:regulator of sigma E protease